MSPTSPLPPETAEGERLDDAIRFQGLLPVCWRPSPQGLDALTLQAANDAVTLLLDALMVMDAPVSLDNDDHDPQTLALQRLQARVDLLVGMVGRLLALQESHPASQAMTLSAGRVRWQGSLAVTAGSEGLLEVFVHPLAMTPLLLPVRILAPGEAEIVGLHGAARNAYEKFLFRQHRRQVAGARQTRDA